MKKIIRVVAVAAAAAVSLTLAYAQLAFRWDGPIGRVVTPNGDGLNDKAIFCFDNPADSDVTGTIYTMLGTQVAHLQPRQGAAAAAACPAGNPTLPKRQILTWDPRNEGGSHGGVYVYQVRAEGKAYTGTIVVVR
jgi:hypothetical protein